MATPLNDMVGVFRRIWGFTKYLGILFFAATLWIIGGEVISIFRTLYAIEPVLGYGFIALAIFLVFWLLGVPIYRFLRMPSVIKPPAVPGKNEAWKSSHVVNRLEFLEGYVSGLEKNPQMSDHGEEVGAALVALRELKADVGRAEEPDAARTAVARFEKDTVDPLLQTLDAEVDRVIRAEALSVGLATALSPNGTLDAFIVLWRNVNLVSRIANTYYGRPGVRGSLTVLRDVSGAALLASYLEGLSEAASGLLTGLLGSLAGVVAGPLVDGGINAIATLRIGYLAKARCRSFKAWNDATRTQALYDAVAAAKDRSKEVLADIAVSAGAGFSRIPGKVGDAVKGGIASLLRKVKGDSAEGSAG